MRSGFEWDPDEAERNFLYHDVDFDEASIMFDDPVLVTFIDDEQSTDEEHHITIGLANKGRLLLVAHACRNDRIRIISARKATKNEEKFYQEAG